jgi:hypothetical protein
VFTGPDGEIRVRPTNVIVANNTEMLRQFALLGMGLAILPSYLIGRDMTRGRLVRLLGDYRLPQVEINVAYPSRRHLPAKVRTFIDHLVEHFSQTPNSQLGEQWVKDGQARPAEAMAAAHNGATHPVVPEAFDGAEPVSELLDSSRGTVEAERAPKTARASTGRTRTSAISPL